jgi:hypothetical protein
LLDPFAVVVLPVPGTVGPVMPSIGPLLLPPPLPTPGSGRDGSCTPPPEPPEPDELPPLLPPELPVGSGSGTLGSGTLTPPLLPELVPPLEVFVGAGVTTEPTVFFTHVPVELRTSPTGHTVTPDAVPAVKVPPRVSAKALAVTTPARRTGVLGDMGKSLRTSTTGGIQWANEGVPVR